LQETIQTNNPLYYQNFVEKKFISIRDVQEIILKDRQALFEWFNGDSAVYILGVTAGKCSLKSINKKNFDSLSSALSLYISDPNLLNENLQKYLSAAHDLYQLIFQDIDVPGGRIIISPDGKYLPVEALVTSLRPVTYFLEDHAVSYTYSARYLLNTFNASSSAYHETFMGIAPLKFAGLPDLKGSDQSLNKVESYFNNATSYIGNNASRNNFLNEFYKYRIIQLYTHATDSGSAGEPMIYFSDSALNLSDLLPEKKPATALIVLSACQTASGKVYSGEGVFSFNRSFAALGIPSSVSNLWRADDRSSYRITELFYQYLAGGMPVDVALQEAKKEFIKTSTLREYQLPYYWAAPILVGKTDKISIQKKQSWVGIAGIALLVSIVAGGWIVRRKKILRDQSHL